jgi:predicted RNase H-like HicB family nuclease
VWDYSETIEEGVNNIREAIELYLESLTEDGLPIPIESARDRYCWF